MAEITEALNSEANNDGNNNEANDDNNNVGNQNENLSTENQEVTLVVPRPPALPPRPPNLILPHAGAIPRVAPPAPYVMQSGKPHKANWGQFFVSKSFVVQISAPEPLVLWFLTVEKHEY